MESRCFIREAKALIEDIKMPQISLATTVEEDIARSQGLQKRINALFQGLSNPTLPSAFNLRDAALEYGYNVAPQVLHRLQQFDTI